jgi:outer membrane protein TolC
VTRLDVWERVVSRYYGVLASRQMLQVAQRAADQARRHADRARALVEAGLRPRIDAVRAEADAQNAEAARLSAADALAVSRVALATAIGDPGLSSVDVVDPGPLAEDDAGPFDAAEGVRQAVGQRPERAALAARIVAQEGVIRSVRARWLPVVAANASFNDSGLEVHELVWNWSVGVSVTVPVLSAVQTTYEYREAKARLARLHADQASLDLALRLEVEQAAAAVNEANVRMAPILAALDAAREALELAQGRYEAGTGDSVELLDAQAALANAEAGEVRARLGVALARVAWNRAVGRIPARLSGEGAP